MKTPHRRHFLPTLLLYALAGASLHAQDEGPNFVTHGPILGRLGSSGIGVWVRTHQSGTFVVRYGAAADALTAATAPVETRLDRDNTGVVFLDGLEPGTEYFYQIALPDSPGPTGRGGSFRTLPNSAALVDPELNPKGLFNFSFEFACGNNQNPAHSMGPSLPTFATMLRKLKGRIDFAILNGDWLYEARREYTTAQWLAQVERPAADLPRDVQVAPTLVAVWENYKHFLSLGHHLARWHREVPSYFTFDDHEILNDVWGAGTPGLRDRRAAFRDIGVRAWYDYLGWSNPTAFPQRAHFGRAQLLENSHVLVDADADFKALDLGQTTNLMVHWGTATAAVNDNALDAVGGDPNAGVYRVARVLDKNQLYIEPAALSSGEVSYSIGRRSYFKVRVANSEFYLLDTRGQRSMHDVEQPDKPGISMLGEAQRSWLMSSMRSSDADFHFVVSSVNLMIPHVGGGKIRAKNKDEAWTVFLEERETLIRFWDQLDARVFVLTGDLHNSFAIRVTDNVWEFASGPHNSENHIAADEGGRPPNGGFRSGKREVDIRWSTYFLPDIPRGQLHYPGYCVVQMNNVFNNPTELGSTRWVAYPRPHVIFQFFDGQTGALRYAETVHARR